MTRLKLEINLERLLKSTETLSRDDSTASNWRLERYVKTLSDMLADLQKRSGKPDAETLNSYRIRIEFLEKLVDSQKILSVKIPVNEMPLVLECEQKDNPVQRGIALQMMSQGMSSLDGISREIKQKTASKCNLDIRNELFGLDNDNKSELRHRRDEKSTGEDLDSLIKYHQNVQEKILSDMLLMTRDLKEQSKLAGTIINKDIETFHKSTGLADRNLSKLKAESAKLDEHNKRAWRCWMWLLIFVVMMMFIFMVLFIKVTKKRTYTVT